MMKMLTRMLSVMLAVMMVNSIEGATIGQYIQSTHYLRDLVQTAGLMDELRNSSAGLWL